MFGFRFMRHGTLFAKSVYAYSKYDEGRLSLFFNFVSEEEAFTEREICYWMRCFALFGFLLDDSETKWRFRLKWASVMEKLRRIPKMWDSFAIGGKYYCIVFLKNKDNRFFTLTKNMYSNDNFIYQFTSVN
jgi:hypothetical protein